MCDLKYTEKFIMSRFFYFFVLLPTDKWKKSIIDSKQTTIWNPMNQMSQLNYYFHCNVQYIWPTGSCMNHTMDNSNNTNVVTDVCHTMCKCQSPNIVSIWERPLWQNVLLKLLPVGEMLCFYYARDEDEDFVKMLHC